MMSYVAAAAAILIGAAFVTFVVARRRASVRLSAGSRVIQTSRGPLEYASVGDGRAVLMFHGGMGGWDQGVVLAVDLLSRDGARPTYARCLALGEQLLARPARIIAPSRVGYLRTPLATGRTPADGADAAAELLRELGISNAAVIGVSGGGPTPLQFAIRHTHLTRSLAMLAAISKAHTQPARTTDNALAGIVFSRMGVWRVDLLVWGVQIIAPWRPRWLVHHLLKAGEAFDADVARRRAGQIAKDSTKFEWLRGLLASAFPFSLRKAGLVNDLQQFATIKEYDLTAIRCPTLVVHGRHDGNVPFDHAEFVANAVPGARLMVVEDCGHFIWVSDQIADVRAAVVEFVHSSSMTQVSATNATAS